MNKIIKRKASRARETEKNQPTYMLKTTIFLEAGFFGKHVSIRYTKGNLKPTNDLLRHFALMDLINSSFIKASLAVPDLISDNLKIGIERVKDFQDPKNENWVNTFFLVLRRRNFFKSLELMDLKLLISECLNISQEEVCNEYFKGFYSH